MRRFWLVAGLLALTGCDSQPPPPADDAPATRIVTLSPGLTELTFAAGAGDLLVGVSAYSDFPQEASAIPQIGDAFAIDQERIAVLQPDLLLVWAGGTPEHVIDELIDAGYRVELISTRNLADIGLALRRIGELTNRSEAADIAAATYEAAMQEHKDQYSDRSTVRVFYQVDRRPLYTINGSHFITELIGVCGGQNIFDDLDALAPTVSVESVIDRNPEAILAGISAGDAAFDEWRRWPNLVAVKNDNLFLMPGDTITRATPRLVEAVDELCAALQVVRDKRDKSID